VFAFDVTGDFVCGDKMNIFGPLSCQIHTPY
jgi:hypothetical protein